MGNPRLHAWILTGLLAFGFSVSVFLGVWDRAEAWTGRTLAFRGPETMEAAHPAIRIALIAGCALLSGWAAGAYRRLAPAFVWLLVFLFLTGSFSIAMSLTGRIVEPFSAWSTCLSVFTMVALMHRRARKRFQILERSGLLPRLAPHITAKLTDGKTPLDFEEHSAEVSLVSLVIRARTSDEGYRLSALLQEAEQILLERGGCLETRAGDHLQIYFGLPKPIAHHGKRACRAALALKARLEALNDREKVPWGLSVVCGRVVAGCKKKGRALTDYSISGALLEEGRQLARRHAAPEPRLAVSPELQAILDNETEKSPTVVAPPLRPTTPSTASS